MIEYDPTTIEPGEEQEYLSPHQRIQKIKAENQPPVEKAPTDDGSADDN